MGAAPSSPDATCVAPDEPAPWWDVATCGVGSTAVNALKDKFVQQGAFVFAKPHANNPHVQSLIRQEFRKVGIRILKEGEISSEEIDKNGYIDQHYYAIASKATILKPNDLNVPLDKFQAAFGEPWPGVLASDRAYNAMDIKQVLGLTDAELDARWGAAKQQGKLVKFGGGFYCALIDEGRRMYTFNAFFMSMRGKFTQPGESIHYFVISVPPSLPWADFRAKVLGPTDPAQAPPGSLRGMIMKDWKSLGLTSAPNTGDNGVHASASPFEGLAERMNWLGVPLTGDSFGQRLLSAGVPAKTIEAWTIDPQVALPGPSGGKTHKKGSLFDQLEDLDAAECLLQCKVIASVQP